VSTIPSYLADLVDDAAIFPPGNAPLASAVDTHADHRNAAYADLVGPFVVSDVRLPDLIAVRQARGPGPALPITVVVTGGAGAIEGAVRWADTDCLDLRSIEFALRDEDDLAHNARRVITAVDQLVASGDLEDDTVVYVEPTRLSGPPTHSWLAALDEVAAVDHRLKFRTGGVDADDFPSAGELAICIQQALDRELRFKCTAGLHHAVRHRDPQTGFEHHGFLNVLLATRASLDGATADGVAAVLDESDPAAIKARVDAVGTDGLVSARRWFTSFGCCDVLEPLEDLIGLDLIEDLERR
jgi:hypothetical protein